jgi:hypothetical protein
MTESQVPKDHTARFQELGDPEFMTRWALLRSSLFFLPRKEPQYPELKRQYDAAALEFRRRMNGGLA